MFRVRFLQVRIVNTLSGCAGRITHHEEVSRLRKVYELVKEARQQVEGEPMFWDCMITHAAPIVVTASRCGHLLDKVPAVLLELRHLRFRVCVQAAQTPALPTTTRVQRLMTGPAHLLCLSLTKSSLETSTHTLPHRSQASGVCITPPFPVPGSTAANYDAHVHCVLAIDMVGHNSPPERSRQRMSGSPINGGTPCPERVGAYYHNPEAVHITPCDPIMTAKERYRDTSLMNVSSGVQAAILRGSQTRTSGQTSASWG